MITFKISCTHFKKTRKKLKMLILMTVFIFIYFILILIFLTRRKATEALIHRVSNYPDLLFKFFYLAFQFYLELFYNFAKLRKVPHNFIRRNNPSKLRIATVSMAFATNRALLFTRPVADFILVTSHTNEKKMSWL